MLRLGKFFEAVEVKFVASRLNFEIKIFVMRFEKFRVTYGKNE